MTTKEYTCEICKKTFDKSQSLCAHKNIHSSNFKLGKRKMISTQKKKGEEKKKDNIKEYNTKNKKCKYCKKRLSYKKRHNTFCNQKCSASFNNQKRSHSQEVKRKIGKSSRLSKKGKWLDLKIRKYIEPWKVSCIVCGKDTKKKKRKTCSKECYRSLLSKKRIDKILEMGTSNTWTKQGNFHYKDHIIMCDSKLEKAGIVWLIDYFKADKIERFKSILNFKDEEITRRWNPDFFIKKGSKRYIVEVKMPARKGKSDYFETIEKKKKSLIEFCNQHKYGMIWMDFDNYPELRRIYKNILKLDAPVSPLSSKQ